MYLDKNKFRRFYIVYTKQGISVGGILPLENIQQCLETVFCHNWSKRLLMASSRIETKDVAEHPMMQNTVFKTELSGPKCQQCWNSVTLLQVNIFFLTALVNLFKELSIVFIFVLTSHSHLTPAQSGLCSPHPNKTTLTHVASELLSPKPTNTSHPVWALPWKIFSSCFQYPKSSWFSYSLSSQSYLLSLSSLCGPYTLRVPRFTFRPSL